MLSFKQFVAKDGGLRKRLHAINTAAHHPISPEQKTQSKAGIGFSAIKAGIAWAGAGAALQGPAGALGGALAGAAYGAGTKAIENAITSRLPYYYQAMMKEHYRRKRD